MGKISNSIGGSVPYNRTVLAVVRPLNAPSFAYANGPDGTGVGATITNTGTQVQLTADTRLMANGERFLLFAGVPEYWGIYVVTAQGSGATNWVATRADDYDEPGEIVSGNTVNVLQGDLYENSIFEMIAASPTDIGNDPIFYVVVPQSLNEMVDWVSFIFDFESRQNGGQSTLGNLGSGNNIKGNVVAMSVDPLSAIYDNGTDGFSASLVGQSVGELILDGYSPDNGDYVYINAQTNQFENGYYIVNDKGSVSTIFDLTRITDWFGGSDLKPFGYISNGDCFFVSNGNTIPGSIWMYKGTSNPIVGTDSLLLTNISASSSSSTLKADYAAFAVNLSGYVYNNGSSGIGATFTAGSNGAFTTDGQSPALNSVIFLPDSGIPGGLYNLTVVGDGSTKAVLTRSSNYNQPFEIQRGGLVEVSSGDAFGGSLWYLINNVPVIGTDAFIFLNIPALNATNTGNFTLDGAVTARLFNGTLGATVVAASTIDLESSTGNIVPVSGSTTINNITLGNGHLRIARFIDSVTLSSSGNILLPTSSSIVAREQDIVLFCGLGFGTVKAMIYQRSDGSALSFGQTLAFNSGASFNIDAKLSNAYVVTLDQASTTATFINSVTNISNRILITFIASAAGARAVTFANCTFASGSSPTISEGLNAETYLWADWNGSDWILWSVSEATVTNFSAVGEDGVSVNVTDPTTTPELTIGLDLITPETVQLRTDGGGFRSPNQVAFVGRYEVWDSANTLYRTFIYTVAGIAPLVEIQKPTNGTLAINDANYLSQTAVAANSSTAYSIDPALAQTHRITLTNNCTVTFVNGESNKAQLIYIRLIQDGTGGHTVVFSNTTYAALVAPAIAAGIGQITLLSAQWDGAQWTLFAAAHDSTGTLYSAERAYNDTGVLLSNGVLADVVSITPPAGTYNIYGCSGFNANGTNPAGASATTVQVFGAIGTASGNVSTGINFSRTYTLPILPTEQGNCTGSVPTSRVTTDGTVTYYLKAVAAYTTGDIYAYGSITAETV